jgi:hypothetical protein
MIEKSTGNIIRMKRKLESVGGGKVNPKIQEKMDKEVKNMQNLLAKMEKLERENAKLANMVSEQGAVEGKKVLEKRARGAKKAGKITGRARIEAARKRMLNRNEC